jgi:hypothetical protein
LGSAHLAGGPLQSTASPPALRPRPTRRNRTVRSRGGIGTAGDTFLLQLRGLAAPVSAASARLALSASRPETEPLERIAATYGGHGVLYSPNTPRSVDICDLDCVCSALLHVDKRGATATTNAGLKTLSDIAHILTHAERRPDRAECLHAEGLHDGAQREAGGAELNARL